MPYNKNDLLNKCDILKGCVNRLLVTDNVDELDDFVISAFQYLNIIYSENVKSLMGVDNE